MSVKSVKKDSFLNNNGKRIIFTLSAFLLLYLVAYIIDPYSPYWQNLLNHDASSLFGEFFSTLIFTLLISESSIRISDWLNKKISWTVQPTRRLMVETLLTLVIILTLNFIFSAICFYSYDEFQLAFWGTNLPMEETRGMIQWVVISVIIAFMIMAINTGNYLISNWKNESLKTAELKQIAIEAELQSLKLQIDPHFVFNNLSVLSELILEDQQLGYEYAENFSKIYRYLLVSSKKDVLTLEEELNFLESYIFLIKQRVGEGVTFSIDVDPEYRRLSLPPLTLQLLVENALKHNKTNKKAPLHISIYCQENNELVVENTLMPIEKTMESSGIGLRNIVRRYNLLSKNQPVVIQNESIFKVELPLLQK